MTNQFDLDTLDALLGPQGFAAVLDRDASTGCTRYASLNRDSFDNGTRIRLTASYVLSMSGRGRRLYNLLTLDLQIRDNVATILCARRLGRLTLAAPFLKGLMTFAQVLASASLPTRSQLSPFLPPQLLDALETNFSETDFPDEGIDREEKLPEQFWECPSISHNGQIDSLALPVTLNLAVGERAQMVDLDPGTGDYRVFHLGAVATPSGGETLTFELHRQGPGFERRFFNVLSLTLGPSNVDGSCSIETFTCDAGTDPADLPRLLPGLAQITAALQNRKRPADTLVLPFLSKPAQILWTQPLVAGGGA